MGRARADAKVELHLDAEGRKENRVSSKDFLELERTWRKKT